VMTNGVPTKSLAKTQSFIGADTLDLVTYDDLGQISRYLTTNTLNGTCLQNLMQAKDDSVISNTTGPCTE
jgi:hypothetical protein